MPKVKERINEMARTMCDCYHDGKCSAHHNAGCALIGSVDCISKQKALSLFRAGYIHISDSKNIVKQAQIDTINTIIKYCENSKHWCELKDCKLWGGKSDDLRKFLNGIIKEVENDK